jgi:hypothetical protein
MLSLTFPLSTPGRERIISMARMRTEVSSKSLRSPAFFIHTCIRPQRNATRANKMRHLRRELRRSAQRDATHHKAQSIAASYRA